MNKTDVTVLITVRNEQDYIGPTIDSILDQTYSNFSLWVIDDGSTDSTWKVISSFKDDRIKKWRFEKNAGMTKRLNWAIPQIKTQFIARMDSHNLAHKDRLKLQHDFMLKHTKVMALGSNFSRITENGKVLMETNFPQDYQTIKDKLMERNIFKHASMFFRREIYDLVGLYDPYFKVAQDYDFVLRVATKFPIENLPNSLVTEIYRQKNMTQLFRVRSSWEALVSQWYALTKYHYPKWQAIYLLRGLAFFGKSILFKIS